MSVSQVSPECGNLNRVSRDASGHTVGHWCLGRKIWPGLHQTGGGTREGGLGGGSGIQNNAKKRVRRGKGRGVQRRHTAVRSKKKRKKQKKKGEGTGAGGKRHAGHN